MRFGKKLSESDANDLSYVLSLPEGARMLQSILDDCGLYKPTYDVAEAQPSNAVYREGQRNAALRLFARISEIPGGKAAVLKAEFTRQQLYDLDQEDLKKRQEEDAYEKR